MSEPDVAKLQADLAEFHAYAFELTKMVTNFIGGGSELFCGRIGRDTPHEIYMADIPFCRHRLEERRKALWDSLNKAEAESRLLRSKESIA